MKSRPLGPPRPVGRGSPWYHEGPVSTLETNAVHVCTQLVTRTIETPDCWRFFFGEPIRAPHEEHSSLSARASPKRSGRRLPSRDVRDELRSKSGVIITSMVRSPSWFNGLRRISGLRRASSSDALRMATHSNRYHFWASKGWCRLWGIFATPTSARNAPSATSDRAPRHHRTLSCGRSAGTRCCTRTTDVD